MPRGFQVHPRAKAESNKCFNFSRLWIGERVGFEPALDSLGSATYRNHNAAGAVNATDAVGHGRAIARRRDRDWLRRPPGRGCQEPAPARYRSARDHRVAPCAPCLWPVSIGKKHQEPGTSRDSGWVEANPAMLLKPPRMALRPTLPFDDGEMSRSWPPPRASRPGARSWRGARDGPATQLLRLAHAGRGLPGAEPPAG